MIGVCYFHTFKRLVAYFKRCRRAVRDPGGIFVCDLFGGSECYESDRRTRRDYGDFIVRLLYLY